MEKIANAKKGMEKYQLIKDIEKNKQSTEKRELKNIN